MKKYHRSFLFILSLFVTILFFPSITWASGWALNNSSVNNTLIGISLSGNTLFAVGTEGTILYSNDSGKTWSQGSSGTSFELNDVYALSESTAVAVGNSATIRRTTDGGKTWKTISPSLLSSNTNSSPSLYTITMASSSIGFAVGQSGTVLKTTDGGASWNQINISIAELSTTDLYTARAISSTKIIIAGEGGAIYSSSDTGTTWTSSTSGTTQLLNAMSFVDSSNGWIGGENRTLLKTTNGGSTWSVSSVSGLETNEMINDVSFRDKSNGILAGLNGALLQTSDGGTTWTSISSSQSTALFDLSYVSSDVRWGVGINGDIFRYDATSPEKPTSLSITGDSNALTDTTPTFTWTAAVDNESSVASYAFKLDSASYTNIGKTTTYTPTTALTNGSHTASLYAIDLVGNISTSVSVSFTVDADSASSSAPVVKTILPVTALKNEGVTYSVRISDDGSIESCDLYIDDENVGAMTILLDIASVTHTFTSNGIKELYARCTDDDGNKTTGKKTIVTVSSGSNHASRGDLIKIGCEGDIYVNDPCTSVYYYGADGKRHAFPTESIFYTWFSDFDDLVILSSTAMSEIPLGSNVTHRPGVKLIQFLSNTVYAVSYGGILRPIANAEIAEALFGRDWTNSIDGVNDVFYGSYEIGSTIHSSTDYSSENTKKTTDSIDELY